MAMIIAAVWIMFTVTMIVFIGVWYLSSQISSVKNDIEEISTKLNDLMSSSQKEHDILCRKGSS